MPKNRTQTHSRPPRATRAASTASAPRSKRAAGTQLPRWLVRNCRRHCSHSNARVARRRDVDARAAVAADAQRAHRSARGEAVAAAAPRAGSSGRRWRPSPRGRRGEQDGEAAARHDCLAQTPTVTLPLQNVIVVVGARLRGRPARSGLASQVARASEAGRSAGQEWPERVVGEIGLSEAARDGRRGSECDRAQRAGSG